MTLMLAATVGAGVLANRLLLGVPVHSMPLRWLLSLVVSYAAFFVFIRVWLAYVGARPLPIDTGDVAMNFDVPYRSGGSVFRGGGGSSGGGGASGDWGVGDAVGIPLKGALDGVGSADEGGCLLALAALVLLALLAAIGGGVVFLIIAAPHMLADAAFSALLAAGLVKSVRRMDEPDWEGSILRATWKPLLLVAAVTFAAGIVATIAFPGARTLGEILMLVR